MYFIIIIIIKYWTLNEYFLILIEIHEVYNIGIILDIWGMKAHRRKFGHNSPDKIGRKPGMSHSRVYALLAHTWKEFLGTLEKKTNIF